MNKLKRLFTCAITLVLAFAMCVPVTAQADATTYTITINNSATGHTYEAYQIFTGDLTTDENNNKVLSNIAWGNGITTAGQTALLTFNGQTYTSAAKLAEAITTTDLAAKFAKAVAGYLQNPTESTAGDGSYAISGLSAGYYLVKDKANTLADKDDFYTAYIMEVVGNVTATPKGDKPTLDKFIFHNDANAGAGEWQKVADNQIGDTVKFKLTATTPTSIGQYDKTTYTFVIHDTLDAGFTYTADGLYATYAAVGAGETTMDTSKYEVTENNGAITVTFKMSELIGTELSANGGDTLNVYYNATLNKSAKIHTDTNVNTAYLEYSNDPNGTTTGKTAEVKVYDYTYTMKVHKIDENNADLDGAVFALSKNGTLGEVAADENGVPTDTTNFIALVATGTANTYRVATAAEIAAADVTKVYAVPAGTAIVQGLDDATDYYFYETKEPTGYNKLAAPVKFNIAATFTADVTAAPTLTVAINDGNAQENLQADVQNEKGTVLPSTGGMGTTIFYVVGGVLVLGAAIALITRRRMKNNG